MSLETVRVFVATAAPEASEFPGLSGGRWYEASPGVWEEKTEDGTTTQYQDVGATGTAESKTARLKLEQDGATFEVFLTAGCALKFANGVFAGELLGTWEVGGVVEEPPAENQVDFVDGPPPVPGARSRASTTQEQSGKAAPPPPPQLGAGKPRPKKADNCDRTPELVEKLYQAAKAGDYAATKRFLDMPVDPDCISPTEGLTPLIVAAQMGKVPVVECLIAAGADVNVGVQGNTPMIAAFTKGRKDVLRVLFGAAFSTLEHAVGPGGQAITDYNAALATSGSVDEEVSPMALAELRDVTAKLATLNKPQEKDEEPEPAVEDAQERNPQQDEKMREDVVRETMKQLITASKAGADAPPSP